MDNKGNIIAGSLAILIVALLIMAVVVFTSVYYITNENIDSKANDNFKYIVDDYSVNLEVLGRDSINDVCDKVYNSFRVSNSKKEISKVLSEKLDDKNREYEEKYDVKITSEVISVENTDSPWKILFKVKLHVEKDGEKYDGVIERNASVEGLKDPLPLAKFSRVSGILFYDGEIHYGKVLAGYLYFRKFDSPWSYLFATSPLYIKKCPYDPYTHHGDEGVLKDCLKNGYFHESADGSCYLCRLEGKGKCPHYGFEVFIQTHTPLTNESLSCSDHVVFEDHYNGQKIDEYDIDSLILDNSHRKKYGIDLYGQEGKLDN